MTETADKPTSKSVSKSVALPENIWAAVDTHAPKTPGKDRSGYIRNLVESDLNKAGALSTERQELEAAVVEVGGPVKAMTILRKSKRAKRRTA